VGAAGSTFVKLRVARDFDNSESVQLFLKSRNLLDDVDALSSSILRLKTEAEERIQEAFYSVVLADDRSTLEAKLSQIALREIGSAKSSAEIRSFVTFSPDPECKNLTVKVIYRCGSQTVEFIVFSLAQQLSDAEVEDEINKHPALSWITDERSPMYSSDAVKSLKIHLLYNRLNNEDISREDRYLFKKYAKEISKKETATETMMPTELIQANKSLVSLIKKLCNIATPEIEVKKLYKPVGDGKIEYQIITVVSGAETFTVGSAARVTIVGGKIKIDSLGGGIKSGDHGSLWKDIFAPEYLKDSLEPDFHRMRYSLSFFKYRVPYKKDERFINELIPLFPPFRATINGDEIALVMKFSRNFSAQSLSGLRMKLRLYESRIQALFSGCADKRIGMTGSIEFKNNPAGENAADFPFWKFSDVVRVENSARRYTDNLSLDVEIILTITSKSKTKYINIIAQMTEDVLFGVALV
jgi:hypothetical protein